MTISNAHERGDTWLDILTPSRSRTWLIDCDEMPCLHYWREKEKIWVRDEFSQTEETYIDEVEDTMMKIYAECRYGHETEGRIRIEVHDSGIGISEEGIGRLF